MAKRAVLINDLERHLVSWAFISLAARITRRHPMFVHDAPLSVLRGFTRDELLASPGGRARERATVAEAHPLPAPPDDPGAERAAMTRAELVVIGGGPAGAALAALAAGRGVKTLVIERDRFPRDKVCGEFVSAEGCAVLGAARSPRHVHREGRDADGRLPARRCEGAIGDGSPSRSAGRGTTGVSASRAPCSTRCSYDTPLAAGRSCARGHRQGAAPHDGRVTGVPQRDAGGAEIAGDARRRRRRPPLDAAARAPSRDRRSADDLCHVVVRIQGPLPRSDAEGCSGASSFTCSRAATPASGRSRGASSISR